MRLSELSGRSVAIWGTGKEGQSAVRTVKNLRTGSLVAVDEKPPRDAAAWQNIAEGVPLHLGQSALPALLRAEVVITSPGVPLVHPWRTKLAEAGVSITSGTALWLGEHAERTIAVTGTKGKSTTSALIHHLMAALDYDVTFSGNIGIPLLSTPEAAWHVVELSSQQCQSLTVSPHWVILTSLFPEHLDWHGSEEAYYRDKLNVIAHEPRRVVVNAFDSRLIEQVAKLHPDVPVVESNAELGFHLGEEPGRGSHFFKGRTPLFPRDALALLGEHNARNLSSALALLSEIGVDCIAERDRIAAALGTFQGLAHRLERIPDPADQLVFVNDSLSTAPQSAIAALESFETVPVTLIVGGADRGLDYSVLRDYLAKVRSSPATVLAIPDSGPRIAAELRGIADVRVEVVTDLAEAVTRAREVTPKGGAVLLSPAAPSYGKFVDHAHRAAVFRQAIAETAKRPK